jgi:flagellar hook-associated protein 3 FlgL
VISTNYNLLTQLAGDGMTIRSQYDQTEEQAATGRVSDTYSGLGAQARTSLDLRPVIAHQSVWQSNIDAAQSRLDVTQTALSSINAIATNFYSQVNNINDVGDSEVTDIAASAKTALQQMGDLLNTKSGNVYIFAGQDTSNPPVPNTDPTVTGPQLLASPPTTAPFSSTIGTAVPEVDVGDGQRHKIGILANANGVAVSSAPTSGSYMRDIMTSLATLANLTAGPTAQATAQSVRSQLSSAISALATDTGALGEVQSTLTQRQSTLAETSTALSSQVSSVEDVDVAATLTKASSLQTQLQASYQIIAESRQLTLTSFLS